MLGYVYIFSSPHQNPFKIGKTGKDPKLRCAELSRETSAPGDFVVEYFVLTDEYSLVEKQVHQALAEYVIKPGKESFLCPLGLAIHTINQVAGERLQKKFYVGLEAGLEKDEPLRLPGTEQVFFDQEVIDDIDPEVAAERQRGLQKEEERAVRREAEIDEKASPKKPKKRRPSSRISLTKGRFITCEMCGETYEVTFLRGEFQTSCPKCFSVNDVEIEW